MVELTENEARKWRAVHSPEAIRRASNFVHNLMGVVIGTAAALALLHEVGILVNILTYLPSALLTISGAFLTLFLLLHHETKNLKLTLKAVWTDPQQRQHLTMGVLLTLAGLMEFLKTAKGSSKKILGLVLPSALVVIGFMFLTHPQHGTAESIRWSKRYHGVLGSLIALAGVLRAFNILFSILGYLWSGVLLVAALMLATYNEPEGSYEEPHVIH
ncbi:hypothetical protein MSHOH_3005 [Methanosarcina horonobensis HB-1 = JCM 15518]|uniref:Cytochrome b561 domain-containing protein n=1 Tax=Methanosarcina horonobensis HB-1 = JCM 15518 TaxID=1434110 RepID=A0A0E3SHX5_9EURY|nr:hypothetical protein [Methanosarcina horonobensis]AKB79488.1 hypothetical protein MSHOH_3005 [Methanosarcina horonobensis HB-1 = JCM 15518]